MRVDAVPSGDAALALAQRRFNETGKLFDFAVIDGTLPDRDGFSTAAELIKMGLVSVGRIIILSCGALQDDMKTSSSLGQVALVRKPLIVTQLHEKIGSLLAGPAHVKLANKAKNGTTLFPKVKPLHVLLVDDNAVNVKVASMFLTKAGFSLTIAQDGAEAFECFKKEKFNLILMDVQMPVMDGLESTRRIRELERPTGAHVPIIALTAHSLKGDDERCLAAGMDAHLGKPIRIAEFFELVGKTLPGSILPDQGGTEPS
jgi:CheY-like chemotaxis protein